MGYKVDNDFKLVWAYRDLTRAGHLTKRETYFRLQVWIIRRFGIRKHKNGMKE